jgi:hypothetical protein
MPSETTYPTPYPDVNAALNAVLAGAQEVLGGHFTGTIVHGSLASGDFDPARSDVDVLIVTEDTLPAGLLTQLAALHQHIAKVHPWAGHMEVSYIPQQSLRRFAPPDVYHPALRVDGSFDVDGHGSEWIIQRHVIRETGIVMAGPDPKTLIDPVSPDDLRRAQLGLLREWWAPQLDAPFRIRDSEYQAYAVLTMCRALFTLEHGSIASKPAAARWAQAALGPRWAPLVEQAYQWRHGVTLDLFDEVLAFIRYTLEHSRQFMPAE